MPLSSCKYCAAEKVDVADCFGDFFEKMLGFGAGFFADIFWASVKSAMQFGTVKYSGRAIRAGFCFAALRTAVLAAVRLSSKCVAYFHVEYADFHVVEPRFMVL